MRTVFRNIMIVLLAFAGVYWLTRQYEAALGDPLFFDGWVLLAAMGLQLLLHVKKRNPGWLLGPATTWRQMHISCGYFVVLVFAAHTDMSLPDTVFEAALWSLFVIVVLSGLVGTYLLSAIPNRLEHHGERLRFETMPAVRFELERRASGLALTLVSDATSLAISDLYANTLHEFFSAPRNISAHLSSSRRPLKRLVFAIDSVEAELGQSGETKLGEIRDLVEAKDRLDFQYAHECALRAWLFVHVPATYALIVLTVLHVAVVYAYRSGV